MTTVTTFDPKELEAKVKAMYRSVAENPKGPLSRLESRLRCPKCGSRDVVVLFQPPPQAVLAR